MKAIPDTLRAKLAKLLRMQQSSNTNEAANAATFVEKICREHGISPTEISADYDPDNDKAVDWFMGKAYKRNANIGAMWLLQAVAEYYNGSVINATVPDRFGYRQPRVFATEGNRIKIELYFTYLEEVMEKLCVKARAAHPYADRGFNASFRKGFALAIRDRLRAMKSAQSVTPEGGPALVPIQRSAMEKRLVNQLVKETYPRLRTTSHKVGGSGVGAGRNAAGGVGLNEQVSAGRRLALAGA